MGLLLQPVFKILLVSLAESLLTTRKDVLKEVSVGQRAAKLWYINFENDQIVPDSNSDPHTCGSTPAMW